MYISPYSTKFPLRQQRLIRYGAATKKTWHKEGVCDRHQEVVPWTLWSLSQVIKTLTQLAFQVHQEEEPFYCVGNQKTRIALIPVTAPKITVVLVKFRLHFLFRKTTTGKHIRIQLSNEKAKIKS